ncbi:MAG: DNA-protecting protein DprA [Actinobacteria bacterium]|nr:DNA-protecting protein DprA [Actinomycetota bacterium]
MADTTFEGVRDERTARAVIASATPPGDYQTNHVLMLTGSGLVTLRLALGDDPIPGLSFAETRLWRRRFDVADSERVFAGVERGHELGQRLLIPGDPYWPAALDPRDFRSPVALWAEGDVGLLVDPLTSRAALVGTDQPSRYGVWVAADLAGWLASDGRTLISLAERGISRAAVEYAHHESNRVILVLPHSLNHPAPGVEDMQARVAATGLLVSARPPDAAPTVADERTASRLLAALSGVTTIVEAPPLSKWLSIGFEASEFDRPVGAVPGSVTERASSGTNELIWQGLARLIADGPDIADLLDRGSTLTLPRLAYDAPFQSAARAASLTR